MKRSVITLLLFAAIGSAFADGDIVAGERKAAVCAACHGAGGNSVNPEWPNLAGQHASYTAKQIRDFMEGKTRNNALMAPMIANLTEEDIADISAYYESQPSTGGYASEALHDLGERIYRGGIVESGVPACIACHGPKGLGNGPAGFPRIAGQHAVYTAKQLDDWRAGARSNDTNSMMADAVRLMSPMEMKAVSEYIAGLH
ncbi:c-type cytochrome [Thioalkalivibrio sp. HK1]|uniref:c-type cytochrome n=1 Tax=Thioalkalivibrio sp. HK1 TaxID=1469245 RepID=UPI000471E7BC|nr:c-type cytochrome [Thioalkalivibrio sp. HK1]